jgi:hypothetical protein
LLAIFTLRPGIVGPSRQREIITDRDASISGSDRWQRNQQISGNVPGITNSARRMG